MQDLRIVGFEKRRIWEKQNLRNTEFEKGRIWEMWAWRQILHFEKAAISIKNVPGNTQELNMISVQDWDQIEQFGSISENVMIGEGLARRVVQPRTTCIYHTYHVVTYVAHSLT